MQSPKLEPKSTLQTCKSSQVIGRKITNVYSGIKSEKLKKFRPNIILLSSPLKKSLETTRNSNKKSFRSTSLNKLGTEKEFKLEIPNFLSPPRLVRQKKEKKKNESLTAESKKKHVKQKSSGIKNILAESLTKLHQEKQELIRKEQEEKAKIEIRKEKIHETNEKIRKKNAKIKRVNELKHPKPWGSDQKSFIEAKYLEIEEVRNKIHTDRDLKKRSPKKHSGSENFLDLNQKKRQKNKSEDKINLKTDPNFLKFIRLKKKSKIDNSLYIKTEEKPKFKPLEGFRMEKPLKTKIIKKKQKSAKLIWSAENEKSTESTQPIERKPEIQTLHSEGTEIEGKTNYESKEILTKRLKDLQKRVKETQDLLKTQAAIIIQRWFRENKQKLKKKSVRSLSDSGRSSSEYKFSNNWVDIFSKTDHFYNKRSSLAQDFTEKLKQKHAEIEERIKKSETANKSLEKEKKYRKSAEKSDEMENDSLDTPENSIKIEKISFPLCSSPINSHRLLHAKNRNISNQSESTRVKKEISQSLEIDSLEILTEKKNYGYDYTRTPVPNPENLANLSMSGDSQYSPRNSFINHDYIPESFDILLPVNKIDPISLQNLDFTRKNEDFKYLPPEKTDNKDLLKTPRNLENEFLINSSKSSPKNLDSNFSISPQSNRSNSESSVNTFRYYPSNDQFKDSLEEFESFSLEPNLIAYEEINLKTQEDSVEIKVRDIYSTGNLEMPENYNEVSNSSKEEWNAKDQVFSQSSENPEKKINSPSNQISEINPNLPLISNEFSDQINFEDHISEIIHSEVKLFLEGIKFKPVYASLNPGEDFIVKYLSKLQEKFIENEEEILEFVNTPAYHDPLQKLFNLKSSERLKNLKFSVLELILPPEISQIIKEDFDSISHPCLHIYLQLIFDCVNESLNYIRPFGIKGLPDPWSNESSILFGEGQIENVVRKIEIKLKSWINVRAGIIFNNDNWGSSEKLQKEREEKIGEFLKISVLEEEIVWVNYDDEETQLKIEVEEQIFKDLVSEALGTIIE